MLGIEEEGRIMKHIWNGPLRKRYMVLSLVSDSQNTWGKLAQNYRARADLETDTLMKERYLSTAAQLDEDNALRQEIYDEIAAQIEMEEGK